MQRLLVLGVQRGDLVYHKRLQAINESDVDELKLAALFTGLYHSRSQVHEALLDSGKDGILICRQVKITAQSTFFSAFIVILSLFQGGSLWYSKVLCIDAVNGPYVLALYFDLSLLPYGPCSDIGNAFSEVFNYFSYLCAMLYFLRRLQEIF